MGMRETESSSSPSASIASSDTSKVSQCGGFAAIHELKFAYFFPPTTLLPTKIPPVEQIRPPRKTYP